MLQYTVVKQTAFEINMLPGGGTRIVYSHGAACAINCFGMEEKYG